ncbi:peptidase S1 [Blomia tropicalis]|nr:peptidase S1 [Blomia tropicalis]
MLKATIIHVDDNVRTDCQKIYENDVTINQFCAMKDGVDACTGDAGGPAASNKVLLGIISWGGEECAQQGKPGVYTNVGQFVDWINIFFLVIMDEKGPQSSIYKSEKLIDELPTMLNCCE